jgi:hypothetical protein
MGCRLPISSDSFVFCFLCTHLALAVSLQANAYTSDSRHGVEVELTADECMSVLKLSTLWNFTSVRASAIESLDPYAYEDPVLKVIAARKFDVREWLVPGVVALSRRQDSLTLADTDRFVEALGDTRAVMHLVLNIAKVRESFAASPIQPIDTELPPACDRQSHDFARAACAVFGCGVDGALVLAGPNPTSTAALLKTSTAPPTIDLIYLRRAKANAEAQAKRIQTKIDTQRARELDAAREEVEEAKDTTAHIAQRLSEADTKLKRLIAELHRAQGEAAALRNQQKEAINAERERARTAEEEAKRKGVEEEARRKVEEVAEEQQKAGEAACVVKKEAEKKASQPAPMGDDGIVSSSIHL